MTYNFYIHIYIEIDNESSYRQNIASGKNNELLHQCNIIRYVIGLYDKYGI